MPGEVCEVVNGVNDREEDRGMEDTQTISLSNYRSNGRGKVFGCWAGVVREVYCMGKKRKVIGVPRLKIRDARYSTNHSLNFR